MQSDGAAPGPTGPRFRWRGLSVETSFLTCSVVREPRTCCMKEGREKLLLSIVVPQLWQQLTPRYIKSISQKRLRCKNTGRQECCSEIIERRQVKRAPSGKYGENPGEPMHFSSHQSSEMQIGDHALGPDRASQHLSICLLNRPVLNRTTDVFIKKRQRRLQRHGYG